MKKVFYLYILTNVTNKVFYVGTTSNLIGRIYLHRNGRGSKFTRKYKTFKLVYFEVSDDMNHILHRERLIKKWKRCWKKELISKLNPYWSDLFLRLI